MNDTTIYEYWPPKNQLWRVVEVTEGGKTWYECHGGFCLVWKREGVTVRFRGKRGLRKAIKLVDKKNKLDAEQNARVTRVVW